MNVRRGWARTRGEDGSAIVEFVVLGVLMMVPLVYLVMSVGRVQAGSYAVTTAAREAGRAFVTAEGGDDAAGRAHAAAGQGQRGRRRGGAGRGPEVHRRRGARLLAREPRVLRSLPVTPARR